MVRPKRAPPLAILAAALIVAQASAAGRNIHRWSPPAPDLDSATSEWVPLSAQPRATEPQAFFAPPPPQFQLHQVPFGQQQLANQFQQQQAQLHNQPQFQQQQAQLHNQPQFQQQQSQLHNQPQFHSPPQLQHSPNFPPSQINQQSPFNLQPPQLPRQQPNNHHFLHQVGIPQNLQHFILTPPKQDFPVPNIQQVLFAPPPPPSPPQPPQQPSLPSLPPLPRLPSLPQRPIGVQHPPLPPPQPQQLQSPSPSPNPALQREKEEVQLLYVPVETLRQRGRLPQPSLPPPPPSTTAAPVQPSSTPTPHQPPLSVYMGPGGDEAKIGDVLQLLKDARTIPVLDQVGPDAPQVFVGPAGLHPPPGYAKFELPYLSSLDSNRIERKVNRLPFFVAPLSFQPPNGYSKILLPPPHIGSVVVSNSTSATPTPVFVSSTTPLPESPSTESSASSGHGVFNLPSQVTPVNPRLPTLVNSLEDTNALGVPAQQVRPSQPQRGRKRPRPHQQALQQTPSTERVFVQSSSVAPSTPSPTQIPSSTSLPPVFSTQEPQDVRITPTERALGPSTERSLRVHQANELHSFIQAAQQEQVDQFHHVTQSPFHLSSPQSLDFPQVTTQAPFRQPQGQFFQSTLEPFGQTHVFSFNQRPAPGENQFVPQKSTEQSQPQNPFRPQHHFVQFPNNEHIFSTPVANPESRPQFKPRQPTFGQAPHNQFRQEQNQFSRPQEDFEANRNLLRQQEQQSEQEDDIPPPQEQFESARNQLRQPHDQGQTNFRPQQEQQTNFRPQQEQQTNFRPQQEQQTNFRQQQEQQTNFRPQQEQQTNFRPQQEQQQHRLASPQQVFETSLGPSQVPPQQPQEQPIQTELPSPSPTPSSAPTPDPTPAQVQVRGRIQGVQEVAVLPQVPIELQRPPHHRQRVQSLPQEPSSTTQPTPTSSVPSRRRARPRPTPNTLPQGVTSDPLAVRFTGKIRNRTRNHQQFIQRQQQEEEQRQVQQQDQQLPVTSPGFPSETTPIPANTVEDENFGQRSTLEEQPTTRAIPTRKYSNFVRPGPRRPTTTVTETPETTTPLSGRTRTTAAPGRRAPFKVNRGRVRARTTTTPSGADEVAPTQPPFTRRRPSTEAPETANEVPDSEEQESVLPPRSSLQSIAERHQTLVQQTGEESDDIPTEKTAVWGDKPQVASEPAVEIVQSSPIASTTFDWSAHSGSQLANGWTADRASPEAVPPIRYDGLGIPSVAGNPVDAPPSDHALPEPDIITTTLEPPVKETAATKKAVVGKKRGSWVRVRVKRPRGGAGGDADGLATAESQNSGVASGNALLPQPLTPSPLLEIETSAVPVTTTPSSITTPVPTVIPTSSDAPPTSTSYDVDVDSTSTPEPFISEEALTTEQPNSTLPPSANSPFVGTSTSTKVSMETEICYRGRCIKTQTQSGQA